jgi:hypothetical protein
MKNAFICGSWILIAHILSACATGKDAQVLARATLSQTLSYENQVNEKIRAEKLYYQKSTTAITKPITPPLDATSDLIIIERAAQTMQKAARASQRDLEPIDITNYVEKLLHDLEVNRKSALLVIKEYNDDLQNNLLQLDKKKSSLKTITTGLEKLQEDSSEAERLKLWFKFAKDVKIIIDKQKEKVPP